MSTRSFHARLLTVALAVLATSVAGCLAPSGQDTCNSVDGEVDYIMETQAQASRDVPASTAARWSLQITCSTEFRTLDSLRITIETPEQQRLVAEGEAKLPNDGTLTLYAPAEDADGDGRSMFREGLPERDIPVYRLRISDDDRSRPGLDDRDLLALTYDAQGRRTFDSQLPLGTYQLTIQDSTSGDRLGAVSHQVFDPDIETVDGTPGTPPGAGVGPDDRS